MLYFSCQIGGDVNGADAWRERLRALWACGYTGFWVFDNFGNPICEVSQPRVLDQLLDSLLRQNQRRASRTLWRARRIRLWRPARLSPSSWRLSCRLFPYALQREVQWRAAPAQ